MKKFLIYTVLASVCINSAVLAQTSDDKYITNFAIQSVLSTFTYDSLSYEKQIADLQKTFTTEGWKNFSSALNQSGNIEIVKENNMVVSAYKNGDATIESYTQNKASENWVVKVPSMVTYSNEYVAIDQPMTSYISIDKSDDALRIANINSEVTAPSSTKTNLPQKRANCHN